jgi:sarcosine oxidase subunit gamma
MSEQHTKPRAFNPLTAASSIEFAERLAVKPSEDVIRYNLRIDPVDRSGASKAFGVELPGRMGDIQSKGQRRAICIGPDEWLLLAPFDEALAIGTAFVDLANTYALSLVDVSDRECGIEIRGTSAAFALMAACPLDLDVMAAGTATRTLFDYADVLIIKENQELFHVTFLRSWSEHVWSLLSVIGREIAAGL